MQCPRCAHQKIVEIRMTIQGDPVTFRRCGRCEAKTWESAEGPISLAHVLDLARVHR